MSSLGSPNSFFLAGKKAYEVERSLRFNDGDNTYLNRTPSSTGNRRTFTWSGWIKRSKLDASDNAHVFFDSRDGESQTIECTFGFLTNNTFFFDVTGAGIRTNALFRDVSAWQHWVIAVDTTQATSSNRVKIYVNGVQETSFSSANYPSQNYETAINAQYLHSIGRYNNGGHHDGYMAEVNFIDGLQLTPASFGATDVITGQWNPKKYTGSYGTNGFHLNFSDNSGTTATTLGKDSSGNSNNFTPNNFSVAAGAGNDSLEDTPTNNFCTLNGVKKDGQTTLSNGNLQAAGSQTSTYNINTQGTFAQSSGKWYYEVEFTSGSGASVVGWARTTLRSSDNPTTGGGIVYRPTNGDYVDLAGNNPTTPPTTSTGTVIQVAIDFDAGKIWFGSGGTYFSSGDPSAGSSEAMTFTGGAELLAPVVRTMASTFNFNFGQRPFTYTQPTGFKTLCSANIPDPTILLPNKQFNTLLYTGNGTDDRDITGVGFQPDWIWIKERNGTRNHALTNSVIGSGFHLESNTTDAEESNANIIQAFQTDGFQVGTNAKVNANSSTYAAWNWNAGDTDGKTYTVTVVSDSGNKYRFDGFGTSAVTLDLAEGGTYIFNYPSAHPLKFSTTSDGTHGGGSEYTTGVTHNSSTQVTIVVAASAPQLFYYCSIHSGMGGAVNTNTTLGSSNFDGSIQSTVKANTSSGFSIGLFTGTGSNASIGHGLGVAPSFVIAKSRSHSDNWFIYHKSLGANAYNMLNSSDAADTGNSTVWQNVSPTSSVFYASTGGYNDSGQNLVFYAFSEVAGYSKFGSYTGNGSADGTFVFLGFRPAVVISKRTDSSGYWRILDNKRDPHNVAHHMLFPNTSDGTSDTDSDSAYNTDFLSNGFKLRTTLASSNSSGGSWIYLAFAESPFKNARAR